MKRQVEIEDTLDERIEEAISEVEDLLMEYLKESPDTEEVPDLYNDLDYDGSVHEIIDGSVPIYTSEIEDTWYLNSRLLEEAYARARFGENPRENNGMTAIYCYIYEEVAEWYYKNAEDIFNERLQENNICPKCGQNFMNHYDDGSCVIDYFLDQKPRKTSS